MSICSSTAKTHASIDGTHALCGRHVRPDKVNPRGKNPIEKRFVSDPSCLTCQKRLSRMTQFEEYQCKREALAQKMFGRRS